MASNQCDTFLSDCEKILVNFHKSLDQSKNMSREIKDYICKCAEQLKKIIVSQQEVIKEYQNKIITEIEQKNARHYDLLVNISQHIFELKEQSSIKTYSEVVRSDSSPKSENRQHVVIIRPNKEKGIKTSTETEKALKSAVDPHKLQLGIKRIKNISEGGLVVECRSDKECQKLIEELSKKTEDVIAGKPQKKKPRLVIKGVNNELNETELIEKIISNMESVNKFLSGMDSDSISGHISFKFKFRRKSRNNDDMYCIEVSPEFRKVLMKNHKNLFIDWKSCPFEDYIPIIRCYNCNGFGHIKANCTQNHISCGHCGQKHSTENCSTDRSAAFCTNCDKHNKIKNQRQKYDTNHSSFSHKCKSFASLQEVLKSKINYE